jgi:hypothetical protein
LNEALDDPEIVTEDGTTRAELEDERLTDVGNPGLVSVTVQVPAEPGTTVVWQVRLRRLGFGSKDMVVLRLDDPKEAVTVAELTCVTDPTFILKVPDVEPVETLTEDGTVKMLLLSDKVTLVPLLGAGLDSVTVQLALPFVVRVDGVHWTELTCIVFVVTTEPPVAVIGIAAAIEPAACAPVIPIVLVPIAADIVRDKVATVPL